MSSLLTPKFFISADGYIRLSPSELQSVRLTHLISGLDEMSPDSPYSGALATTIGGYTEWGCNAIPAISIGWDWEMSGSNMLRRVNSTRSNIMLLDASRRDFLEQKSAIFLDIFIDALDWQSIVFQYVATRYK